MLVNLQNFKLEQSYSFIKIDLSIAREELSRTLQKTMLDWREDIMNYLQKRRS